MGLVLEKRSGFGMILCVHFFGLIINYLSERGN